MKRYKAKQNIKINGTDRFSGLVFDGKNTARYLTVRGRDDKNSSMALIISRYELPPNSRCSTMSDEVRENIRKSPVDPNMDFFMIFENKENAINVAEWVLNSVGIELPPKELLKPIERADNKEQSGD